MRPAAPAVLRIALGPSRRLAVALIAAHLLAAAGAVASRLPGAVTVAMLFALAVSLAYALRRHAWRASARSLVHLELSENLDLAVADRRGRRRAGSVLGSSFVAPWLVVIHFKAEGNRLLRTVVVPPDATDAESHRALRVWLRWRRADAAQDV